MELKDFLFKGLWSVLGFIAGFILIGFLSTFMFSYLISHNIIQP